MTNSKQLSKLYFICIVIIVFSSIENFKKCTDDRMKIEDILVMCLISYCFHHYEIKQKKFNKDSQALKNAYISKQ